MKSFYDVRLFSKQQEFSFAMDNAQKYYFSDFRTENFRRLIQIAKKNYHFRTFTNFDAKENFILWRHDVDYSIHRARKLAQIEAEEAVQATYFLLLHSEFYNLLEKDVTECVYAIIDAGHELGLHFDVHYYNLATEETLKQYLLYEKELLEQLFKKEIHVFSFHVTNEFTMRCTKEWYGGLINVYSEYFQKDVGYCSDSNGYWRHRRLENVLTEAKDPRLQVLTHPSAWQDDVMSPRERVWRCIDGRAQKTRAWYKNLLQVYQREDIDWK